MAELNLILLGPGGAGKGTQGEHITADGGLAYVVTGNILRAAVKAGTELGVQAKSFMDAGDLVPDELVIGLILERVRSEEAKDGFVLDGFPRNVAQGEALDAALAELGRDLNGVLYLDVPDEEIVRRLSGRRVSESGRVYHLETNPPKVDGICDVDGTPLIQRDDDKPETIRKRLAVYHESTEPLVDYYESRGLLHRFDGAAPAAEVEAHLRKTISTLRLEDAV
jgi:adenylate kinase